MFAQLGLGVRDKAVPRDLTSSDDQAHVGLFAVIGPFTVTSFDSALQHAWDVDTAGDETEKRRINPRLVLAQAWHPEKLQAAQRQLAVGEPIHPIDVTGLRVPGLPELFTVTDGMHRTVAARLADHDEIRATVCGY